IKGQELPLIEVAVRDPSGPAAVEAMRLVLQSQNLTPLKSALDGTNALAVTEALGNTGEKQIVPLLQPILSDPKNSVDLRKRVVHALANVQEGAAALLEMAVAGKLSEDLRLSASMDLNNVRWPSLKAQASEVLPLPRSRSAEPLPGVTQLVKLIGDPQKGAVV